MNQLDYYRVTCKCEKCGRKQVIKVSDLASGQTQCRLGGIGRPACSGALNYYAEDREESILNARSVLGYINLTGFRGEKLFSSFECNSSFKELVNTVVDDVGCWSEHEQTPQEMGWVGQSGLP